MRRITLAVLSTIALLVLIFSYRTSLGGGVAAQPARPAHLVTSVGSGATTTGQGPDPTAPAAGAGSSPTVVDGSSEMTRYGPVQVRVTITDSKISDVTAIDYPDAERRDREIAAFALPQLRTEVLAAQSAHVDAVSGATSTTKGYLASLQSALDLAHFAS